MIYLFKILIIVLSIIVFVLLVVFSFAEKKKYGKSLKLCEKDMKSFKIYFYPASYRIYIILKNIFHISLKTEKLNNLKKINIGSEDTVIEEMYFCRLFSVIIPALMCISFFIAFFAITSKEDFVIEKNYFIRRQEPEGSSRQVEIDVSIGNEKRKTIIDVNAKRYDKKELAEKLKEAKKYVKDNFLGENISCQKVDKKLNLISFVPDNAIQVSWKCDSNNIVSEDGSVNRLELVEPEEIEITAIFTYHDTEEEMPLQLTVLPVEKSDSEMMWDEWDKMFGRLEKETADKDYLKLPSVINGMKILYQEEAENPILIIILSSIIFIVLIPAFADSRIKENVRQREQELHMDYPEFVEKFTLLISAGLNCKGAWYRITDEYNAKREKDKNKKGRCLYEEMLFTRRHLENGMNESRAYEMFGKRIGLINYMKFSTLLVQNLKKGTSDLLNILDYEAEDALKERRENAKLLGEQASTKLLMPMMIMMVEIFAIILYAAFQNM